MIRYQRYLVLAVTLFLSPPLVASADNFEFVGSSCGMTSTNDSTALISQNPSLQFGFAQAGPVVANDVMDDPSPGPAHGQLTPGLLMACWVQVNDGYPANPGGGSAHVTGTGAGVVTLLGQIEFQANSSDNVYLCTALFLDADPVYYSWYYDDDPSSPGDQCALAVSSGAERRAGQASRYAVEPSLFTTVRL